MKRLLGVVLAHVSLHLLQLSDTDLRCLCRVAAASGFSMVPPAFFTFLGGKGLFKVRRSTAQQWRHGATLLASASTESSFPSRSHCRLRTSRFSPLSDGTVCLFLNSQLIFQHKDKPMSSLFNLDHKVRAQGFLLRVLALDKMKILRS